MPHCIFDVLVTQTLPLQQPTHVLGPHDVLVSGGPASWTALPEPPELPELPLPELLPKPLPLPLDDDDSMLPDEPPLPLEELPPDDEPLLPDDPVDELWLAGPPSSPPSNEP